MKLLNAITFLSVALLSSTVNAAELVKAEQVKPAQVVDLAKLDINANIEKLVVVTPSAQIIAKNLLSEQPDLNNKKENMRTARVIAE